MFSEVTAYLQFYRGTQACRVNTPRQTSGTGKGSFHFEIQEKGAHRYSPMHLCNVRFTEGRTK